jgi:hypothetical protein
MLWRAIATSSRKIKPSGASYLVERQAQILDLWLIRSRCFPLSIQIDIDGGYSLPPQVIGTLVSHRARWGHLKFYFYRCPPLLLEDPCLCYATWILRVASLPAGYFPMHLCSAQSSWTIWMGSSLYREWCIASSLSRNPLWNWDLSFLISYFRTWNRWYSSRQRCTRGRCI